tara:strand:- start:44 stop:628 length:585 start_codon:yes stop_codon:yes gene_type:complete
MSEIHEAPIVHGRISVNNIVSNSITFSNGSTLNNVDTTLDKNSSNPLTNSVITTTINNITSPSYDNFNVHLVMNPSASHSSLGTIIFPTRNALVNDFSSGGPDSFNSSVTLPVAGIYTVFFQTTAYDQANNISSSLDVDGQALTPIVATGKLTFSSTMTFPAASQIALRSNTAVAARSELHVCLVKRDQTLPGA